MFDRVVNGRHPVVILVIDCWQVLGFQLPGRQSRRKVIQEVGSRSHRQLRSMFATRMLIIDDNNPVNPVNPHFNRCSMSTTSIKK